MTALLIEWSEIFHGVEGHTNTPYTIEVFDFGDCCDWGVFETDFDWAPEQRVYIALSDANDPPLVLYAAQDAAVRALELFLDPPTPVAPGQLALFEVNS
jgi:hypothetical protein